MRQSQCEAAFNNLTNSQKELLMNQADENSVNLTLGFGQPQERGSLLNNAKFIEESNILDLNAIRKGSFSKKGNTANVLENVTSPYPNNSENHIDFQQYGISKLERKISELPKGPDHPHIALELDNYLLESNVDGEYNTKLQRFDTREKEDFEKLMMHESTMDIKDIQAKIHSEIKEMKASSKGGEPGHGRRMSLDEELDLYCSSNFDNENSG